MNCLIVDDEILAREVLQLFVERTNGLELKGSCANAVEAFVVLNNETIDVVLLDIKMPEISGIDFIKSLKHPPKVIITTAYPEYALEGYDLDIVDYLMKPIRYERFLKAIEKARALSAKARSSTSQRENVLFVKSERKLVRILPEDIVYIEGLKNYLVIHTQDSRKVVVHSSFLSMEQKLNTYQNMRRVHKSFLINTNHIQEVENHVIKMTDAAQIPVGSSYRQEFYGFLKLV